MFYDNWNDPVGPGLQSPWAYQTTHEPPYIAPMNHSVSIVITCKGRAWLQLGGLGKFITPTPEDHQLTTDRHARYFTLPARIDGRDVNYSMGQSDGYRIHFHPDETTKLLRDMGGGSTVKFMLPRKRWELLFTFPLTGYIEAREEACELP